MSKKSEDRATVDVAVVGGGIVGLWVAKRAVEAGLSVALIEANRIGAGASATPLGALTAHIPDRWNAKKQYQYDALTALPETVAALEAQTGASVGYCRAGRIMPIRSDAFLTQVHQRREQAARHWAAPAPGFVYEARDSASEADWLDGAEAIVWDSLAARISAPAYTAALAAWLRPRARVIEGARYAGWDGAIRLGSGERITAGAVVLAQGFSLFAALEALMGGSVGAGVKGQVAMLRLPETYAWVRRRPLIYDDGVYVVPKQDPLPGGGVGVALGGTDEKTWRDPSSADPAKAVFIERAHILCPTLRAGDVVSHWAGVRPKCWQRDPIVGRLPVEAPLWVVGGGFKISLGIAHRLGESLVDRLTARDPHAPLPETFEVAHHLAAMRPLKATPDQST